MQSRGSAEEELRRRISAGRYPPGSRIPTRRELAAELDIGSATLQLAFDRLIEQGFLEARGKQGTFVAEHPPDLACCAMVFADEPNEGSWNRFWSAFHREAQSWRDAQGRRFAIHCLLHSGLETTAHRRLCADAVEGGLSGLFFVSRPWYLRGSPLLASPLPMVSIGRSDEPTGDPGSVISFSDDWPALFRLLRERGRSRVALIGAHPHAQDRRLRELIQRSGLATRPEWMIGQSTDPFGAEGAHAVAHLLFSLPPGQRPDALVIADDNLVPHATAGVNDAGIAEADLTILAHANFPHPTVAARPCLRYGIDVRDLMAAALDEIARLRGGGQPRNLQVAQRMP